MREGVRRPSFAVLGPTPGTVFVTGKGGVGKTTFATALAAAAARVHGQAVYVEFSDGQSGRRAGIRRESDVEHVVLDLRDAVLKAAEELFGSKRIARFALGNFAMKPLIKAAPALRELGVLELARQVVVNRPGVPVVFDMPASGHCVGWLKTPGQVRKLAAHGPLHSLCARLEDQLLSPSKASMVVVTLPERLVLSETLLLNRTLEDEVGLPVDRIIVNRVPPAPSEQALTDAARLAALPGPEGAAAAQLVERLAADLEAREDALAIVREAASGAESWSETRPPVFVPLSASDPDVPTLATQLMDRRAA
ncbi:MAG: ArsA-related P-loop ATPase [Myxococcota bacterium]